MATLAQIVDRHLTLAELYGQPSDLDRAAEHRREADRLVAEAEAQIAAHPQIRRARRPVAAALSPLGAEGHWRRRLAAATASDADPDEVMKHTLVAAQLQAIRDGDDATAAADRVRARLAPAGTDVPPEALSAPSDA